MPNRNKEEGGHSVLQREGPVGVYSCRERDMICGNNSCVYGAVEFHSLLLLKPQKVMSSQPKCLGTRESSAVTRRP